MKPRLVPGVYDEVVTRGLRKELESTSLAHFTAKLDKAESSRFLARIVFAVVERVLAEVPEKERPAKQIEIVNDVLGVLARVEPSATDEEDLVDAAGELLAAAVEKGQSAPVLPLIPLSEAALLVNGRGEPRVGEEIRREIASANRVDLLCAFIKWYGLTVIDEVLSHHLASGRALRVITTTYMGATELRPLQWLVDQGAQVRVSYDAEVTRLHAKAWLFHRESGATTALVGSSNLSRSALLDGAEWNVRLSKRTTPAVIEKFAATFDSYWNDEGFEPFDADRLSRALRHESRTSVALDFAHVDVHPFPHQSDVLERLHVERERHGRWKNLVVAATGTGKTMIAAFDYKRVRETLAPQGGSARLLFVAHRKEILEQSLRIFRTVLRDGAFGELFVDGHRPEEWSHVFASVQSLASHGPERIAPDAFDVVIVDEFHHAAAPTYRKLIERLRPRLLLGLTATPERADGESVTTWFGDHIAAELRLWDALDRKLLAPFQYFGVHDDVDLSRIHWSRGGYDRAALEGVYTGNDARTAKVIEQLRRRVPDVRRMRALGFCVGVEHAKYMARKFSEVGIPARAVWGGADSPDRDDALRDLRSRVINVVFAVDLFNEGVDVPEIDTVLFLRPTESATVFTQQLGRGLRRVDDKPCLTVLDFIGAQHGKFRFDARYATLLSCPQREVLHHVESSFPFLPAGCHLELDRVARDVVLRNLKDAVARPDALVRELRALGDVPLATFLVETGALLVDVFKGGRTFQSLRRAAGFATPPEGPHEASLARAMERILHIDDEERTRRYVDWLTNGVDVDAIPPRERRLARMLHVALRAREPWASLSSSFVDLVGHPGIRADLAAVLEILDARSETITREIPALGEVPIRLHARYSRAEILAAFDMHEVARPVPHQAGVAWCKAHNADLFFVTLKKSEREFSPTTMYRDYALSPSLFHWESQSATAEGSSTGQRYIHHAERGSSVLLFVRETKGDAFMSLGLACYVRHQGERPMAIEWRLDSAMPDAFFRRATVVG